MLDGGEEGEEEAVDEAEDVEGVFIGSFILRQEPFYIKQDLLSKIDTAIETTYLICSSHNSSCGSHFRQTFCKTTLLDLFKRT